MKICRIKQGNKFEDIKHFIYLTNEYGKPSEKFIDSFVDNFGHAIINNNYEIKLNGSQFKELDELWIKIKQDCEENNVEYVLHFGSLFYYIIANEAENYLENKLGMPWKRLSDNDKLDELKKFIRNFDDYRLKVKQYLESEMPERLERLEKYIGDFDSYTIEEEHVDKTIEEPVDNTNEEEHVDNTNEEVSREEHIDNMDKTIKTIHKTVAEYETTLPEEHYNSIGEAVAKAISGETLKVEIVHTEEEMHNEIKEKVNKTEYTAEDFNKEICLPDGITLNTLETLLKIKHFMLFTAAPGTGKTTAAIALANYMLKERESDRLTIMSFNKATEYCDIVSGLHQDKYGIWRNVNGIIKNVCEKAERDENSLYVIILDEINRGDTLKALGEYLTAMSKIGEKIVSNSGEEIVIPNNVYMIATMNTVDSSVISLDAALRDRFAIIDMKQVKFTVESIRKDKNDSPELKKAIELVIEYINKVNEKLANDRIKKEENQIGMRQLYTDYNTVEELKLVVKYCIEPQIEILQSNLDTEYIDDIKRLTTELINKLDNKGGITSESKE